jgi:Mn2+/Fe2+ NRAMP family transporter
MARRTFAIAPATMWRRAWVQPVAAMVPFVVATIVMERNWHADGYALFFFQVALALPLAAAGAFLLGLNAAERALVREIAVRRALRLLVWRQT